MIEKVFAAASVVPASVNPAPAAGVIQLQQLVQRMINLSVGLAFIAVTIGVTWGGIKYLTSGGEAKNIEEANRIVTWGLLGILFLVIAFLAIILINNFSGVDVVDFCIGFPGGYNLNAGGCK